MQCNQRFFGQRHFEPGTAERQWCERLGRLKPRMSAGGFALRDQLPALPDHCGGLAQVKYNGMLAVAMWDLALSRFVVWNHRGRCFFSLDDDHTHPVTAWLDAHEQELRDFILLGETHVVSPGTDGRNYMTPFNRSMSLIKNPTTTTDVARIKLAVFDYRRRDAVDTESLPQPTNIERFRALRGMDLFDSGVDAGPVHLVESMDVSGSFEAERPRLQALWDEQVGVLGFEGLVAHASDGQSYKIKYRDTLDAAIIAFREIAGGVLCNSCDARFDLLGMIQLVKAGALSMNDWFDGERRLTRQLAVGEPCPVCGATTVPGAKAVLGAKIALLRQDGLFVDIADGAQLSKKSPLLWDLEPLYSADGYLWVQPTRVIEVSYQDVYADRPRPLYGFTDGRYHAKGQMQAVSLRPYGARTRDDKSVNVDDLRLEQLHHLVDRIHRIDGMTT
jgi:hypothetical protein